MKVDLKPVESMSTEELWIFYWEINSTLVTKMTAEKRVIEDRLNHLDQRGRVRTTILSRRHYPKVLPKFWNPDAPFETWAGRGKRPRWLVEKLRGGGSIDDFRISIRKRVDAGALEMR